MNQRVAVTGRLETLARLNALFAPQTRLLDLIQRPPTAPTTFRLYEWRDRWIVRSAHGSNLVRRIR